MKQETWYSRGRIGRVLASVVFLGVLTFAGAISVESGDGTATTPYPAPIPVPNGPYIPVGDTLSDTTTVVNP